MCGTQPGGRWVLRIALGHGQLVAGYYASRSDETPSQRLIRRLGAATRRERGTLHLRASVVGCSVILILGDERKRREEDSPRSHRGVEAVAIAGVGTSVESGVEGLWKRSAEWRQASQVSTNRALRSRILRERCPVGLDSDADRAPCVPHTAKSPNNLTVQGERTPPVGCRAM